MDPLLKLFKQKPYDNWQWTLNPNETKWSQENALALANCALLAYSDFDFIDQHLKKRGFKTVIPFNYDGHHSTDTQAYVAFRSDATILSFRGTEPTNMQDFLTDLCAKQISFASRFGFNGWGNIHEGFARGVDIVLAGVLSALKNHSDAATKLWITGHSLGGALAVITAAILSEVKKDRIAGVYTYGQPRLGDHTFCGRYDEQLKNVTYRHVNDHDLVPHLPPRTLSGLGAIVFGAVSYEHVGQLRLLLPHGNLTDDPAVEITKEPNFLKNGTTFGTLILGLLQFLAGAPKGIMDHFPINQKSKDGYVDRLLAPR